MWLLLSTEYIHTSYLKRRGGGEPWRHREPIIQSLGGKLSGEPRYHPLFPFPVSSLKRLVAGEFPGTHATDYLSSKDRQSHAAVRPQLPPPHSASKQIKLLLSLTPDGPTSLEPFCNLHCTSHFKVVITGLDLLSLGHKYVLSAQLECLLQCNMALRHIKIDPSLIDARSVSLLPVLSPSAILSFIVPSQLEKEEKYVKIFTHLFKSISLVHGLFTNTYDERIFSALLSVSHCKVRALGILQPTLSRNESQTRRVIVKFLQHNSETIEYLQLRPYFLTTMLMPLLTQLQCSNLRVLNIDSCGQSSREKEFHLGIDIFNSLHELYNLEFFEWSEVINLRTTDILALYRLLSSGLLKLRHWHMYLNKLLLSTMDLHSELHFVLLPLLEPLLTGKVGDESCTTYMFAFSHPAFISWLQSLRDDVCFKTGSHRDCPSLQLRNLFPWLGYYWEPSNKFLS